jgi:hypothetical protein
MFYLYYILPNRRLCKVNNKQGVHQSAPTKEEASELAKPFSFEYPVTLDERGDLHNTRDNKPCDTPLESNNPRLYLDVPAPQQA